MSILKTPFINQYCSDRFLNKLSQYVTVFGSSGRMYDNDQHPYAMLGRSLGQSLAEHGYTVMTGGGPGLMMQTNKGAFMADKSKSVGCTIDIFTEETNSYMSSYFKATTLSLRKRVLIEKAQCFVCLPGGYGTLDELFEVLTLEKIKHLPQRPKIFLLNAAFWQPLNAFLQSIKQQGMMTDKDMEFYETVDSIEPILNHLTAATLEDVETI